MLLQFIPYDKADNHVNASQNMLGHHDSHLIANTPTIFEKLSG